MRRQLDDAAGREWHAPADGLRWAGSRAAGGSRVATDAADHCARRADERAGRRAPEVSSEGHLKAVLAAMADAVLVYDVDGHIVDANGALAAILGLDAEPAFAELPMAERGRRMMPRTLDGRPMAPYEWPAARILAGEELTGERTVDMAFTAPDGREVCANAAGGPLRDDEGRTIGAVVVLRDVTERRRLERELAARSAELEAIFATQAEGVVFADASGRILRMNDAQRRLLAERGVDPAEEHVDAWSSHAPPQDMAGRPVPREELPFYRALRGEVLVGERAVELRQRVADGRELALRISAAPMRDGQGRIIGVVLTSDDVSEQRRMEMQRVDVMRVVAHDLANPVASVRLYVEVQRRQLARGLQPFTPDDLLLDSMEQALARIQRLLDDLKVATSLEMGGLSLRRERCDLAELCRREAAAQRAATGREVRVQTPPAPVWAEVDGERVGQVLANLLTNALAYSPADRPVDVEVALRGGGSAGGGGEAAWVRVRDEGPGIPETERGRVFDQFYRVPGIEAMDGSTGLGLGLYISKGIVGLHGGTMGVESEVGRGSTFWFTLPLGPAAG